MQQFAEMDCQCPGCPGCEVYTSVGMRCQENRLRAHRGNWFPPSQRRCHNCVAPQSAATAGAAGGAAAAPAVAGAGGAVQQQDVLQELQALRAEIQHLRERVTALEVEIHSWGS